MRDDLPEVEAAAPGILVARYEWPHLLLPEAQGDLVSRALEASAQGPVGLVFVLAERIREVSPVVKVFWRKVVNGPAFHISAMAIVSGAWAVEVEALGFGVIVERRGARVRVETFARESDGIAWAERVVRSDQPVLQGT